MWSLICTLLLLIGCQRAPMLCDDFDPADLHSSLKIQHMMAAPIVVVATVTNVRAISTGLPARKQPDMLVDLMEADIHVENTLKGGTPLGHASFYFFEFAPSNVNGYSGPPRYHLTPGERRIVFLANQSGRLRAVRDVLDYTIQVFSGEHEESSVQGRDIGESIANVLLTVGRNATSGAMARTMSEVSSVADQVTSRSHNVELLNALFSEKTDTHLSASACFELTARYYGQYGCLAEILTDMKFAPDLRKKAGGLLVKARRDTIALKRSLSTYPLLAFTKAPRATDIGAVREELQMLLSDPDTSIRKAACAVLRLNYPESEIRCKVAEGHSTP